MDLVFQPSPGSGVPLFRQLAEHLYSLVETGRLAPGTRLPATRELAEILGLGRNTVARAYEALTLKEVFVARVGQGTFVAAPLAGVASPRADGADEESQPRGFAWGALLARRAGGEGLPRQLSEVAKPVPYDFRGGVVDPDSIPDRDLAWAFSRTFSSAERCREMSVHRDPFGWPPLREEIVRHLVSRGIHCSVDDVAVVNGSQHAIHLVARTLVDPGDTVLMEDPGYFGAAIALRACEAHIVGVGVDAQGMRTDELERLCQARRPKLIYTTPATQCPTGVRLSETRRRRLLDIVDRYQVPLFEDDYDAELRFSGPVAPALKTADRAGQIIYAGTFSKVLFPSLRLGYVVAPKPLLGAMVSSRWRADFGTQVVSQEAVASLLRTGALDRHLKRVRSIYGERLQALLEALENTMPEGVQWSRPLGGQGVWVTVPKPVDVNALIAKVRAEGVAFDSGAFFSLDHSDRNAFMLAFTSMSPQALRLGVEILAREIGAVLSPPGRQTKQTTKQRRSRGGASTGDSKAGHPGGCDDAT